MKRNIALSARAAGTAALLALFTFVAPVASADDAKERALCADATEDPKSLLECVKSLNKRVSELEDEVDIEAPDDTDEKIARLEAELKAARAEIAALKDKPNEVKAPFTVVDDSGEALLTVHANGDDTEVIVGGGGNAVTLTAGETAKVHLGSGYTNYTQLTASNGTSSLELQRGDSRIQLGALADGAYSKYQGGGDSTEVLAAPKFVGVIVSKGGGESANLGTPSSGASGVRIFDSQHQRVATMGANPGQGGAGAVHLGSKDGNSVVMEAKSDGSGRLDVFSSGQAQIALEGKALAVSIYGDTGQPLIQLSKSPNSGGGNVTAYSAASAGVFSAGGADDGGGEACVTRQDGKTHCLGVGLPLR